MHATLLRTAAEARLIDATPLRAEMTTTTFINDALRDQAQTVVDTRNHVYDAIEDMRRTLLIFVSIAVSTAMIMQTASRTPHPAPASPRQDHPPTPLSSHSVISRHSTYFAPTAAHMQHAHVPPSQRAPHLTKDKAFTQRATHTGGNPPSPTNMEPSTPPSRSVTTSAPNRAPHAPTQMDIDKANARLPPPCNLVTQWTMHPRFRQAAIFGHTAWQTGTRQFRHDRCAGFPKLPTI